MFPSLMGDPRFCIDVVVAVAVSERSAKTRPPSYLYSEPICSSFLQTHPQQNMIASGSIDSDLTVKVWVDRGSTWVASSPTFWVAPVLLCSILILSLYCTSIARRAHLFIKHYGLSWFENYCINSIPARRRPIKQILFGFKQYYLDSLSCCEMVMIIVQRYYYSMRKTNRGRRMRMR